MDKKTKTTFSSIILGGLIIYLAYSSFTSSISYYYEVSELTAQADTVNGSIVNVNGTVVPGSIEWDPDSVLLTFTLTDNISHINVIYNDAIPNNLKSDIPVTVTGIYYANNTLAARSILTKCPSKYEAQVTGEQQEI